MTQRIITIDTSLKNRKEKEPDYRQLKKELNKFYKFGFKMPRKGKDFNPQQKTVLRKRLNEVKDYVSRTGEIKKDQVSFIKYNKKIKPKDLKGVDAIKTNRGIIYKYPDAKAAIDPDTKKPRIVIVPKGVKGGAQLAEQRFEELFLFPPNVVNDPDRMQIFVERLREKYSPDDIRFSTVGKRASVRYDAKFFDFYFALFWYDEPDEVPEEIIEQFDEQGTPLIDTDVWKARKVRETMDARDEYYNGVFLIYYVSAGSRITRRPSKKKSKKKSKKNK